LVRNDVPQLAIYQIVAFLWRTDCYKINLLVVAHWLNMLCKQGGVKWRNCYQRNVNVTQLFPYALSYSGVYRPGKLANE